MSSYFCIGMQWSALDGGITKGYKESSRDTRNISCFDYDSDFLGVSVVKTSNYIRSIYEVYYM